MSFIGSLLGSVATGLVGGLFSSFSTSSTNSTNSSINAKQLAESQRQFDENLDWTKQSYYESQDFSRELMASQYGYDSQLQNQQYQNQRLLNEQAYANQLGLNENAYQYQLALNQQAQEYYSIGAQMERAREAGLNPNLLFSSANLGSATGGTATSGSASAGSAAGANVGSGTSPTSGGVSPSIAGMIPMQHSQAVEAALVDGLFNFQQRLAQARKSNAEAESLEISNKFADKRYMHELNKLKADVFSEQMRGELLDRENSYKAATFSTDVLKNNLEALQMKVNMGYMASQVALNDVQSAKLEKEIGWMDERTRVELALRTAEAYMYTKHANLSDERAKTEIENRLSSQSQPFRSMSEEQRSRYVEKMVQSLEKQVIQQTEDLFLKPIGTVLNAIKR